MKEDILPAFDFSWIIFNNYFSINRPIMITTCFIVSLWLLILVVDLLDEVYMFLLSDDIVIKNFLSAKWVLFVLLPHQQTTDRMWQITEWQSDSPKSDALHFFNAQHTT